MNTLHRKPRTAYLTAYLAGTAWIACTLAPSIARAEPTRELYIGEPDEVFQGDPVSTSLDAQGRISAGPTLVERSIQSDRSDLAVLAMEPAPDGTLYVGTARGGLVRIDKAGKRTVVAKTEGKAVTAIASTPAGIY